MPVQPPSRSTGSLPIGQMDTDLDAEIAAFDKAAADRSRRPAPKAPEPDGLEDFPVELVQALSAVLTELGLMAAPTDTVTPEFRQALQQIADLSEPGLYDTTNDRDLLEVIQGVMNGTLKPSGQPGPVGKPGTTDALGIQSVGGSSPSRAVPAPSGGGGPPGSAY